MVTAEELAAALEGSVQEPYVCSECGRSFANESGLRIHTARAHRSNTRRRTRSRAPSKSTEKAAPGTEESGGRERSRPAAPATASDRLIYEVVDRAIDYTRGAGGLLVMFGFPHTGIALAGAEVDGKIVVQSRALMAREILFQRAKASERVLAFLQTYNRFFEDSDAAIIVGGLTATLAVDAQIVKPDLKLEFGPFQGERALKPVMFVAGDVVEYVAEQNRQFQEQQAAQNGQQPAVGAPAEVVEGGVEAT